MLICTYRSKTLKLLINVTVAFCSALLTTFIYKYFHKEQDEVIFFNGIQSYCNSHCGTRTTIITLKNSECSTCKVYKIIEWLNKTKKTLDICMYTFNHKLLANAVIDAHKRGVRVRLIVNNDNDTTWEMGIVGIAKKVKKTDSLGMIMHHKFLVIDNNNVILGSLNWTISGIRYNWENLFISNNCKLVDPFKKQFEYLWTQFD